MAESAHGYSIRWFLMPEGFTLWLRTDIMYSQFFTVALQGICLHRLIPVFAVLTSKNEVTKPYQNHYRVNRQGILIWNLDYPVFYLSCLVCICDINKNNDFDN